MLAQKLGKIIKKIRNNKMLTQAYLAEKANISVNYIGDIENGRKKISLEYFLSICQALEINPAQIIDILNQDILEVQTMSVQFEIIKRAYHDWKNLNVTISQDMNSRKINFPEPISENIVCYALGMTRNMGSILGDATDSEGRLVEIKATSNFYSDLSSFSPTTRFDRLIFVRLNLETDEAYIYDLGLNGDQFSQLQVNSLQTVADQQNQGRRPRLSLINYIEANNIQPLQILSLR